MPIPPKQSVTHYRGDTLTIEIACWTNAAKTQPADFAAGPATVTSQIRETIDGPQIPTSPEFTVDTNGGTIILSLTPAEVQQLPKSTVWDVQVDWQSDGANVQTIAQGTLAIEPDVTHD